MNYIIGIGANIGFKLENIHKAINHVSDIDHTTIINKASLYSSKALLKSNSPEEWNLIYLNTAIKIQTNLKFIELLNELKNIEKIIGRDLNAPIWSPRLIDLDILNCDQLIFKTDELYIPHKELLNRNFALAPLLELDNNWVHPSQKKLNLHNRLNKLNPIYKLNQTLSYTMRMGIINLSEKSFSDGDLNDSQRNKNLFKLIEDGAEIIDIGAESTSPKAEAITVEKETEKLNHFLNFFKKNIKKLKFNPLISIDTRKFKVMQNILAKHNDIIWMINDVECNNIQEKAKLIAKYNKKYVITHNLGIIGRDKYLNKKNSITKICNYINSKKNDLTKNNVDQKNIYFDLGFGFGKKSQTAIHLLENINIIKKKLQLKSLIGHSRKASILNLNKNASIEQLDYATKKLSAKLEKNNIEIIRVHKI